MTDNWYIEYDPIINEELFQRIVENLIKKGDRPLIHCNFEVKYEHFKRERFFRTGWGLDGQWGGTFSVDNNSQGLQKVLLTELLK